MREFDQKDVASGALLIVVGGAIALYSFLSYPLGTLRRIDTGFLPMVLGIIIVAFGFMLLLPALTRTGKFPSIEWRSLLWVSASILFFGLTVEHLGVVPAIIGLVVIATFADDKLGMMGKLILAAVLCISAVFIFNSALGIPLSLFSWNW